MKYGLLVARTLKGGRSNGYKNIGDYIQNLAAMQFLPHIDEFYDREAPDNGIDTIAMIMNAWYMWDPKYFPVSDRIVPLPISMHISPLIADELLADDKIIEWFKRNSPIGCRDYGTVSLLKAKGIDAYFSGCLTLTLGKCYKSDKHNDILLFVDPYLPKSLKEVDLFKLISFCLLHFCFWLKFSSKFKHRYCPDSKIKRLICSAIFLTIYSKIFTFNELFDAEYITHVVKVGNGTDLLTDGDKLEYAKRLLMKYSTAKLVITSRLHCALPCLALGTTCLFVRNREIEEDSSLDSAGRFDGLLNLLNTIQIKKCQILNNKFNINDLKNKDEYKEIAERLSKQCNEFIKKVDNFEI